MIFRDWLKELDYTLLQGSVDVETEDVIYDSRKAAPGKAFVAMKGIRVDGHSFIPQVLKAGVRVLVTERPVEEELKNSGLSEEELKQVTVVMVEEGRHALALLSAAVLTIRLKAGNDRCNRNQGKDHHYPYDPCYFTGCRKEVGMIGTTGTVIGNVVTPTLNTTPESYELHQAFAQMVEAGCEYAVMEVSSQGIKMHRTDGLYFNYAIFTNISPDHIGPGEHADFEEYLYYKTRLLNMCGIGLVNKDDKHAPQIIKAANCELCTYSEESKEADFVASDIRYVSQPDFVGTEFHISGKYDMEVRLGIPGLFNVVNALAAVSVCSFLGLDQARISHALENIRVNGRMEIVYTSERCTVLVDYAHNAVSMESLLSTLRDYKPKRLVCVFGCGGNRSKDRRYSMGEIGGKMADLSIITADNSRYEKVEDIIADIRGSIEKTGGKFIEIPDRREAIRYSILHAQPGDMVAVIGKGHEDYQEINGVRHHFLDREVIEETVKELGEKA
mgnify:CR=1 FL=1